MKKTPIDIYGDVEGNPLIISRILLYYDRSHKNIFLGDLIGNVDRPQELKRSIVFIEWLIRKHTKIEHKNIGQMNQFKLWNQRGLNVSSKARRHLKEYLKQPIKKINFIIGNKEVRAWKRFTKLDLNDHEKTVLETYFSMCVPFIIKDDILMSHSYYLIDDLMREGFTPKLTISGHSRSYGEYHYKNIPVRIIDTTQYYSSRKEDLNMKDYARPPIKITSEDSFETGTSRFYTEEFKLKPSKESDEESCDESCEESSEESTDEESNDEQ